MRNSNLILIVAFCSVAIILMASKLTGDEQEEPLHHIDGPLFLLKNTSHTKIDFINTITEDSKRNIITYQGYYDGGGVAIADFNNDGLPEIFFTGNAIQNRLYLNKGDLVFDDITFSAGLKESGLGWYTGVTVVDINHDGWMDIYVCKSGLFSEKNRKNILYINNGDLTFTDKAAEYGLDNAGYSTQASFFDFDQDGDLDMYLTNYGTADKALQRLDKNEVRKTSDLFKGDKLFENVNGKYIDITKNAGIIDHANGFAHAAGVGDFNSDGLPDIFVSNDFTEHDYYYINNGDKTFTESAKSSFKHLSTYSMGNDVSDFNNDGLLDIVAVDMVAEDNKRLKENMGGMQKNDFDLFLEQGYHYQYMFNMLHMNTGNATFSEIAHLAGISNTDWSWAPLFADFDNDGWKDIYITNGLKRDARNQDARYVFVDLLKKANREGRKSLTEAEWKEALDAMGSEKLKNYMYKNVNGLKFEKMTDDWGLGITSFSNGAAYGDLDNDGDLDLVVNNINDLAFVFENQDNKSNNYLDIDLMGSVKNLNGIGATIKIWQSGNLQVKQQQFNHGFRSSMAGPIHFGLGKAKKVDSLQIIWPDSKSQIVFNLDSNQKVELAYSHATTKGRDQQQHQQVVFQNTNDQLGSQYHHSENKFDDYHREVLLPHTMSALGPFISVGDVDADGLEDFYIGGAIGFSGKLYIQNKEGKFHLKAQAAFENDKQYEDANSVFFDFDQDGDQDMYVVSGGNEFDAGSNMYQDRLYENDGTGNFSKVDILPKIGISGSIVKANDFDKDGDLDLFVGGRQSPGNYPNPTASIILENVQGKFVDVTSKIAPVLNSIGMVTSAEWIDFDNDNDIDLILAGEWMPITVLTNDGGLFKKANVPGLENSSGWWFSLSVADMDNDGDQDFIVGNVGLNYKYKASTDNPFEVYSKDFDNNGKNDIVLAFHEGDALYPLRGKSCSAQQIPALSEKFTTYKSFASANLIDVYGQPELDSALSLKAQLFASVYVENKGNGNFEIHELPDYAQFSSINGIVVQDIDKDGLKDLIVAGNMYGSEIETVRNDAGYGMCLLNEGTNHFSAFPFQNSGLYIDGDVKSLVKIKTKKGYCLLAGANQGNLQMISPIDSF